MKGLGMFLILHEYSIFFLLNAFELQVIGSKNKIKKTPASAIEINGNANE